MSQHDYDIANQSFPAFRTDLNNVLGAINSSNSGTSRPSGAVAGTIWLDTSGGVTAYLLKFFDGTDDITMGTINTTANTIDWSDSALDVVTDTTPQLGGNLDLNSKDITGTGNINITGTIQSSGNITGTLATVAQPNITSTGTLTTFTSTGIDDNATSTAITINSSEQVEFTAGTVSLPAVTTTGDVNTGIFFPAADTIAFTEGGTEAMRITSAGNVGIGTASPSVKFQTTLASSSVSGIAATGAALFENSGNCDVVIGAGTSSKSRIAFADSGDWIVGRIDYDHSDNSMRFGTNTTAERMRIDDNGDVFIGKTASNQAVAGIELQKVGVIVVSRPEAPLLLNRTSTDGVMLYFNQDGSTEGNISVSGATVSYNGFTGSHWSRFIDESKPDVLRGTVIESLDQIVDWYAVEFETSYTEQDEDGNDIVKTTTQKKPYALKANEQDGDVITYAWEKQDEDDNNIIEQVQATIVKEVDVKHVMSKISDTSEAKNVYGVFSAWDNDDLINNDFYVASVGSFVVRIKAGEVVSKGDLLQSNGDGTAKVQSDDNIKSSSFAKVLSTTVIETYEDGSYLVPCSLMC